MTAARLMHHRRRLDPADVRRQWEAGADVAALARAWGVSPRTVRRLVRRMDGSAARPPPPWIDLAERTPDDLRRLIETVRRLRWRFGMRWVVKALRCDPVVVRALLAPTDYLTSRDQHLALLERNEPASELSRRLGCSVRTVQRWRVYAQVRRVVLHVCAPGVLAQAGR